MSWATLERAVLAGAKVKFQNPRLRLKNLMEWCSAKISPEEGEVTDYVSNPGVWVTIKKELDKREKP